jgi:predicted ArsR family transcriptional regulator
MSTKPLPLEHLADPARRGILESLGEGANRGVEELAQAAGVHANTARAHLRALERAGLVERGTEDAGVRGRPRALYRLADGWRMPGADFKGLADLLAQSLAALDPKPDRVRALGREWGRYLAGRPGSAEAQALLPKVLGDLGFEARMERSTVVLESCPCPLVLDHRPELVCCLAAGVVDGVIGAARERLYVRAVKHDPQARSCRLRLARLRATAAG